MCRPSISVMCLAALLAGLVAGFLAPSAGATANCTHPGPGFAGYQGYTTPPASWATTPEGSSSYLVTKSTPVPVCSNLTYPYTFSAAWVMLEDQNTTSGHYAQAGYIYVNSSGCARYFTEYNLTTVDSGMHRTISAGCAIQDQRHPYHVKYVGQPGPYPSTTGSMELDAYGLVSFPNFDPWQLGWSFAPQYLGEANYLDNNIPGTASSPAAYTGMAFKASLQARSFLCRAI